jgi:subtilase family serine protease
LIRLASPQRSAKSVRLRLVAFEERAQPSVATGPVMHPDLVVRPFAAAGPGGGLSPAQVRHAYGFDQLADDGAGQTIAVVTAYDDPNIGNDLAVFDQAFGLSAPPSFNKAVSPGTPVDGGWAGETALDVEWAHAMAPKASILLVEAKSASTSDLLAAVDYARRQPGVSVVSMSWGGSESSYLTTKDGYFTTPAGHAPVTFVAAAGDSGSEAEWPASSPNVLAVGGTSLRTGSGGSYGGESAWSGSGGGFSRVYSVPTYQAGVVTGHRAVPDVAYDADPNTGLAVYSSVPDGGRTGWEVVGGTSAGAPQWAALIALANQERAAHGMAAVGRAQDTLYSLPSSAFHDVTTGYNGYSARAGYDLITGRGTPVANLLVPELAGVTPPTTTAPNPSPPTGTGTGSTSGTGGTATGTGSTGGTIPTNPPPVRGVGFPVWYWPGSGWGFGGGLFGWNLGGWSMAGGYRIPVWFGF